jgi:mannose-6-phosphate isomerase-like protein (cupin superfamily)
MYGNANQPHDDTSTGQVQRPAAFIKRKELPVTEFAREFEGATHGGVDLSLVLTRAQPGEGPSLHRHPYDEVHVVQTGKALFVAGDTRGVLRAGDIAIVPAGVPHRFENSGRGVLRDVGIHLSSRFITDWLRRSG